MHRYIFEPYALSLEANHEMVEHRDVYISDEISTAGDGERCAGWAGAYTGPRVTRDHAALAGSCDWDAV